ncbi:NhaA family Na+:H+ antiporter [Dysgonomonas sp. PH5-45]|uniref:Na+/H+ antiporter NhaA n=1 Tax=unclassified Dysgonomonas TaxID=2630389 RepID=UPI002476417D|nr:MULTISPECIES: Na+/H+ antiporter NhaA [unclassified Dysgonomonas]MDH6355021.1 NhaA family Na+:H+ antiporter [Dysgonomonas sp. PH5-45]MDH6387921.1 NhaA family Na+:H+ antiporter [Dysgonomonas sp. PH5-37]
MPSLSFVKSFFKSEQAVGIILVLCALVSLILTNTPIGEYYSGLWHHDIIGGINLELIINDGLMAVFFLMVGLELVREMKIGELSNPKNVLLPISAAIGGMIVPALIYSLFNYNTPTQSGFGIPMATDIAFALGILSLLGNRVPVSLKIFLMTLAVIDDLGAIIVIAIFYTKDLDFLSLAASIAIFVLLLLFKRSKVKYALPYIIGGVFMWFFMLKSGIHATIAGVLLAFTIPFGESADKKSMSLSFLHKLHYPVSFAILPLFALANTAIHVNTDLQHMLAENEVLGILAGLILGKPIGIVLACFLVVKALKLASLPSYTNWKSIVGIGFLGGIGFTMSIFITMLAFAEASVIDNSKLSILIGSLLSGAIGYIVLKWNLKNEQDTHLS